jgi:hypothetical protein
VASFGPRPLYTRRKSTVIQSIGGRVGFSTGLRALEKNKIWFPLSGIEPHANPIPTELSQISLSREGRTKWKFEVVGLVHRSIEQNRVNVTYQIKVRQENDRRTKHEYESEVERIKKEEVVAKFEMLPTHLPLWTEENHEKPQDSRCSGRQSNRAPA